MQDLIKRKKRAPFWTFCVIVDVTDDKFSPTCSSTLFILSMDQWNVLHSVSVSRASTAKLKISFWCLTNFYDNMFMFENGFPLHLGKLKPKTHGHLVDEALGTLKGIKSREKMESGYSLNGNLRNVSAFAKRTSYAALTSAIVDHGWLSFELLSRGLLGFRRMVFLSPAARAVQSLHRSGTWPDSVPTLPRRLIKQC